MANNRVALDSAWCNLIAQEDRYYRVIAKYLLLSEGIERPSEKQIQEKINYLSHIYIKISLGLGKLLNKYEIRCIYESACGKGTKEIADSTNISEGVIRKYRDSAFKKLRTQKISKAIYLATQLGYLPLKEAPLPLKSIKSKEVENASI